MEYTASNAFFSSPSPGVSRFVSFLSHIDVSTYLNIEKSFDMVPEIFSLTVRIEYQVSTYHRISNCVSLEVIFNPFQIRKISFVYGF